MVPLWKSVIFSSFYLISNAQDYSLGDWSVTGALNTATTQFYGAVDQETSTAYVSGGLVSDTQAKNLVESIKFDVEDDTLTMLSCFHLIETLIVNKI